MKKTMLHSAIAAVIATFAVASSAAVITVDGTQKPITDTTIGGLVVQNGAPPLSMPTARTSASTRKPTSRQQKGKRFTLARTDRPTGQDRIPHHQCQHVEFCFALSEQEQ